MNNRPLQRVISAVTHLRSMQERSNTIEFPRTLGELYAEYLTLPGLVGFWPMSSVFKSNGNVADLSGQGRTLTENGNPVFDLLNSIVPYADLDGTGDFFSRADEVDLSILGTEAAFPASRRGLTLGGWFNQDNLTGDQGLMGKWTTAGNLREYKLYSNAGVVTLGISSNGTAEATYAGSTVTAATWYFAVGRWIPSTTGDIFVSGVKTSNVSGVASTTDLTSPFRIGDRGDGTTLFIGNTALCFLCANQLPDARIQRLFKLGRLFFGV
jgi:hypothetical protein